MSNRSWTLALVAVVLASTFVSSHQAAAGDGSVRFLTAGPVGLGDGHTGHMRVFVPAVQRSIRIHFLGEGGAVLTTRELEPPTTSGPFFEAVFDATFTEGQTGARRGTMVITDVTGAIVHEGASDGVLAMLIALPNAAGMGTIQVADRAGQIVGILPYIEQDNLFRR
jgi:hypothetical protein